MQNPDKWEAMKQVLSCAPIKTLLQWTLEKLRDITEIICLALAKPLPIVIWLISNVAKRLNVHAETKGTICIWYMDLGCRVRTTEGRNFVPVPSLPKGEKSLPMLILCFFMNLRTKAKYTAAAPFKLIRLSQEKETITNGHHELS